MTYRLPQKDWDTHQPQLRNSTIGTSLLLSRHYFPIQINRNCCKSV